MMSYKHILTWLYLLCLTSHSALASAPIFGAEGDKELKRVGTVLRDSYGRETPEGWKIVDTKYFSTVADNREGHLDKSDYLNGSEIEEDLKACMTSCTVKKIGLDTIQCELKRHESEDLGVGFIHYIRGKTLSLKKDIDEQKLSGEQQ